MSPRPQRPALQTSVARPALKQLFHQASRCKQLYAVAGSDNGVKENAQELSEALDLDVQTGARSTGLLFWMTLHRRGHRFDPEMDPMQRRSVMVKNSSANSSFRYFPRLPQPGEPEDTNKRSLQKQVHAI